LVSNYFDIQIDFTLPPEQANYPKDSGWALRAKIVNLYNGHTKLSYEDSDGFEAKVKDFTKLWIRKIRYGISVKPDLLGFMFGELFWIKYDSKGVKAHLEIRRVNDLDGFE